MTDTEQLEEVLKAIGMVGADDFQKGTIMIHMLEAKEYLKSAGVKTGILNSRKVLGLLARGVLDLWNYGAGSTKLSQYFIERAVQLSYEDEIAEEDEEKNETIKAGFKTVDGKIFYTSSGELFVPVSV